MSLQRSSPPKMSPVVGVGAVLIPWHVWMALSKLRKQKVEGRADEERSRASNPSVSRGSLVHSAYTFEVEAL
jgi:hypothetical protein